MINPATTAPISTNIAAPSPANDELMRRLTEYAERKARVSFAPIDHPDNIQRETLSGVTGEQQVRDMYAATGCEVIEIEMDAVQS